MATIIRGKDKGKEVKLTQWCNDWASCDDGETRLITNFIFTVEEIEAFLAHDNNGTLFQEFKLLKNNRFVRNSGGW